MEKAFLLTVSDDMNYAWGMRFAASFFHHKEEIRLTLLYVAPSGYTDAQSQAETTLSEGQQRKGREMVTEARQWLAGHGFPEKLIDTKVIPKQHGVVRDIIAEARRGLYDAVVVGRRYLDCLERVFTTSVSRGLLWEGGDFPVWVCNQPAPERSNILLCTDGSSSCANVADHVGFMMSHEPRHRVTVLHLREGGITPESALEEAIVRLRENGVEESRISTLVMDAKDKTRTILRLADEGEYAVVAVGRRQDLPESLVQCLFKSSVSLGLHEHVNKFSLWVSR